jgi:Mg2+-importing ATPase
LRKKKVAHRRESNLSSLGRPVQASACERYLNSFPTVPADPSLYTAPDQDLLARLGSSTNGLTSDQAERILKEVGPNTVAAGGRRSIVMDILHRCKNPLVVQLLVMAGLFYWTDDPGDASIVGAMVVLSVILSYVH